MYSQPYNLVILYLNLTQETGPDTPNVVRYLLQLETVPVCLRCMEMGGDLTKSVNLTLLNILISY